MKQRKKICIYFICCISSSKMIYYPSDHLTVTDQMRWINMGRGCGNTIQGVSCCFPSNYSHLPSPRFLSAKEYIWHTLSQLLMSYDLHGKSVFIRLNIIMKFHNFLHLHFASKHPLASFLCIYFSTCYHCHLPWYFGAPDSSFSLFL